jgi:hypothetical protein
MPIYSIDVKIYATAYIRADSEKEATEIAQSLSQTALELPDCEDISNGDEPIAITGTTLDGPNLPDISFSPAMTLYGPDEGITAEYSNDDGQEEDEEEDDGDEGACFECGDHRLIGGKCTTCGATS